MCYFTYRDGIFYVNYELGDAYDSEVIDCLYCYDYDKIRDWCEAEHMNFPFEVNILYADLFYDDSEDETVSPLSMFVNSFCKLVDNGEIKIYCKEL